MTDNESTKELAPPTKEGEDDTKEAATTESKGSDAAELISNAELLKRLPPDARKVVEIGMSMHRFGPMPNPLTEKLTEKHIDKILDISAKDDERSFADTAHSRWFTLAYVCLFLALFIFLTIFLVGADKELYKEAVKLFAVFLVVSVEVLALRATWTARDKNYPETRAGASNQ